jgi:hypothetical protein
MKWRDIKSKEQDLIIVLQKDLVENRMIMLEHFQRTWRCIQQLNEIAPQRTSFLTLRVFDLLYDAEQILKELGFKEGMESIVTGNLIRPSTLVVKKPLEKVTVMLANDTAQNKTVGFTIGPTLNKTNTTPMMPLMGLTLTYAHTHTSTLTQLTHEQHTGNRTNTDRRVNVTVRRNR